MMQEHRQQSTSEGQLGTLAHILKKFKILKRMYHAKLLKRTVIKEHLKCFRDG
jgi:hypothetical protein